jgi:hypothetical protein
MLKHVSASLFFTGLLSAHLPPRLDWLRLVGRAQIVSWWRHLLRSAHQFLDSCYDVLLLHFQFAQNPVSLEEIPDNGAADTVLHRYTVFNMQFHPDARGRNVEAVPGTWYSGLGDGQPLYPVYAFLQESIPKEAK